ncbi:3'-5' exonuclease [Stenotrophomonas sp. W1S232]|uniref:DNA-directed DNA polymerase n=1 Tax=Stenotrophomonas koreensis TaxID=266128 RepID=A0A7W3UZH3_9GAMM|nr:3'-5' exonuclease [Stenotrophomonas koreensis]MBB1116157.1 3'-5' exonuclease [Stenotrophomonas koreensis]
MTTLLILLVLGAITYWLYRRSRTSGAPEINISHLPEQFVVFDLETTGLDPSKHQIIEIGAIRVNRSSDRHDTYQNLIKAKRKLPKKIVELTGITDDLLKSDGVALDEALKEFSTFVGELRLISFNADFDLAFLHSAAAQHGIEFRNPTSCALKMARRAWPKRGSFRLIDLARDGKLSMSNQHRALGDCERALHVYIAAASKLRAV